MSLTTVLLWILLCKNIDLVIIRVEEGLLRGEVLRGSIGNNHFCSFKGIPYAAPPVGQLRFKAPEPPLKWSGERNATKHGSVCPQIKVHTNEFIRGNEDCLFLNVYTPSTNSKSSLPVMFFIHGGGFGSGSGNDDEYGPDYLIDRCVVIVTFNYRLGALGFLSLDIKEVPGNAGLKDQVAALQWVKRNIKQFGGDPNKVTIFGQDAGGASVTLHTLSPMSKGYFKSAIAMSGVCFGEFVEAFEPRRQAFQLTYKIGLYTKDPYKALKFLQNATVKAIMTTKTNLLARDEIKDYVLKFQTFTPVVEKPMGGQHFLTEKPEQLLRKGQTNIKEIVLGYTTYEGLATVASQQEYIYEVYPYFKEILVPSKLYLTRNPKRVLDLADCIESHYFQGKEMDPENIKEFITLYSYTFYIHDIYRFSEMWIRCTNNSKVYLYEFNCFSERNINGLNAVKYGLRGAGHGDDLMYLFDGKKHNLNTNKNCTSFKMITVFCSLFANVAKCGNPTPDKSLGVEWSPYNKNQGILYINSGNVPTMKANFKEIDFWTNLYHSARRRFS